MPSTDSTARNVSTQALETVFEHATRAQRVYAQTDDHTEAVKAFAEERDPEFTGE